MQVEIFEKSKPKVPYMNPKIELSYVFSKRLFAHINFSYVFKTTFQMNVSKLHNWNLPVTDLWTKLSFMAFRNILQDIVNILQLWDRCLGEPCKKKDIEPKFPTFFKVQLDISNFSLQKCIWRGGRNVPKQFGRRFYVLQSLRWTQYVHQFEPQKSEGKPFKNLWPWC